MDRRRAPAGKALGWSRNDVLVCAVLFAIPILVYAIPTALGHPNLPGDDRIQNFPLRVLVGQQLSHGTLPTFNPYIWGGAPLLGGWNAGALYPFTALFAFLPAAGAWAINEMAVYWVGALGMYALLRALRLRPLSSWLGAATFAYAGSFDVQLVHFGLVAGMSWIPLILLALVRLTRDLAWPRRAGWVGVLGAAGAMSVLAGEPRAIDTMLVVVILYFAWLVVRQGIHRMRFVGSVAASASLAALVSAVQWLPGAMAVSTSQRATGTYALFTSGSLNPRWLSLLFVPNLLGGSGSFGTSSWFVSYSLPEVMGYAGLLAIAAAFGLIGTLGRRRPLPEWLVWEVMSVAGILLALGGGTPLGHLFAHIPLFGGQRLQSRNIAVTDIALAALLAYWVEEILRRRVDPAIGVRHLAKLDRFQLLSLAPIAVAGLLSVAALADPDWVARVLGATADQATRAAGQRPLFVLALLLVLSVGVLVLGLPRLAVPSRAWVLAAIALTDLAVFNVTSLWPIAVGPAAISNLGAAALHPASKASPTLVHLAASLGSSSRYAIYNPLHYSAAPVEPLQMPDLNLFDGRFSAQGYSSIVDADYADATGGHAPAGKGLETLSRSAISDGVLNQMNTTTLVTLPLYLMVVHPAPVSPSGQAPSDQSAAIRETGLRTIKSGADAEWVFGESLDVKAISLPLLGAGGQGGPTSWTIGLMKPGGSVTWQSSARVTERAHSIEVVLARPSSATGLLFTSTRYRGRVGPPNVSTRDGVSYTANGDLADALASGWSFAGDLGQYAYFTNLHAAAPLTLLSLSGLSLRGASVHALTGPATEPGSALVSSPHGVTLVRSVTDIGGWSATWHRGREPDQLLKIQRHGVVQAVVVPAGRGVVTWTYDAPGVAWGVAMTLVGTAMLVVLLGVVLISRRVVGSR